MKYLSLLGLVSAVLADTCGTSEYDPVQYVCHDSNFLCPIVAGEPLSYCSGACYSAFMYTCADNALAQLPAHSGAFSLAASNPAAAAVDGLAVTACGLHWYLGGSTCAYCPDNVSQYCPAGTDTLMSGGSSSCSMDVVVPGGQQVYLDSADWSVGYTQAHTASMPAGSLTTGLVAYEGGGFVNLNSNGWGWAACPSDSSNGPYLLHAINETNAAGFVDCTPVNLKVTDVAEGVYGAWQYI